MSGAECSIFDRELEAWLDRSWDEPEAGVPGQLSLHAERCSRCARRLAASRRLLGTAHEPPTHLAEDVLERIGQRHAPRRIGFAVYAAAAAAVLAVAVGYFFGLREGSSTLTVILTLNAPDASSVSVVGDWNGWDSAADPMRDPDEDGVWEVRLKLPSRGEYMYQFVIDQARRTPDPLAPINVDDGFGGTNSVLHL